jgi:ABC-2 type transport system permease protein
VIRAVRIITGKDLRQRLRDKSFFLLGILTPFALAMVLNLVFGGLDEGELEVRMGVVDADQTDPSAGLLGRIAELDGAGGLDVTTLPADADVEAEVGDLDAIVVIPAGFGDALNGNGLPGLHLVENPDRPIQAGVAGSIADGFAAEIERTRLLVAAAGQLGAQPDLSVAVADVEFTQESPGGEALGTNARLMAGMAIMFVFFTVSFGVTTLLNEREDGTLARLLAAPIPRDAILAAKALVSYVLGVLATLILMVTATALLGAEWGPWAGVAALVLAAVLTAVALMAVVAGLAKTAEAAGAIQAIIAVGLALLGGSWFPVSDDGVLGVLARGTPHYWFLDGLENLARASAWTVVGPSVAALAIIAVLSGAPAAMLLRRRLAP